MQEKKFLNPYICGIRSALQPHHRIMLGRIFSAVRGLKTILVLAS